MFGFLKKKLKEAVGKFTKTAEDVSEETDETQLTTEETLVLEEEKKEALLEEKKETKVSTPKQKKESKPKVKKSSSKSAVSSTVVKSVKEEPISVIESIEEELIATTPEAVEVIDEPVELVDAPQALIEEDVEEDVAEEDVASDAKVNIDDSLEDFIEPVDEIVHELDILEEKTIINGPESVIEKETKEGIAESKMEATATVQVKEAVHADLLEEDLKDATKKKKGFFTKLKERIVKFQLTEEAFEEVFWDFELALLENGVAVEVIDKIKTDLQAALTQENISRKSVEQIILDTLKESLAAVLDCPSFDLLAKTKEKSPLVICIVGVNGSGKTTTIGKLIKLFQKHDKSIVVAAADTFRAAAIQQLEEHTTALGVKLIKHDYNADPAAVAFDAVKHATAKKLDVVIIDTAGRLQSNSNLMDELKKVIRINKPDVTLFVGEAITGNDCVEQAVAFNEAVGIDGLVLSKADIDEKGGAAISVSFVTKKPILYLGVGQTYDDLIPFDKQAVLDSLGL